MGSRIRESPDKIFDVYMEVVHSGSAGPEVRRIFPEKYADQETLQTVPKFCFPFNLDSVAEGQGEENFTFVLTDAESKQRFGFCHLSYGTHSCSCILGYLPWFEVFYKLLNMLDDYTTTGQESLRREVLESLYASSVPVPGMSVHLSVHASFIVPDLKKLPSIPENRNLTEYCVAVDVNNMLHLYASMLYERRILISSSKLSTLTACIHGAAAMLYPMYWQHVYIPVLPQHLIDYCCAPMPYLIGVHSSLMEKVSGMALDDVVILNVDSNTIESPFEDLQSLPNDVVSALKSRLKKVSVMVGDGVARAFLKAQAALFGSYRNALRIELEEPITFNEEAFITHRSNTMRQFLQNATQLQLFKEFIDGRLDLLNSGEGFSDVFEEEINMGEYAGSDKVYHQWLLTFKKGGGAFFNTVKTKANPAMRTVYKFAKDHAKIGIKEVKSRLKQKELTENGYISSRDESGSTDSGSTHSKDAHNWEPRRPMTLYFGQKSRYTRPLAAQSLHSRMGLDNHHELPLPYKPLNDKDLVDEVENIQGHTAPTSPIINMFSGLSTVGDSSSSHQGEPSHSFLKHNARSMFSSAWNLDELLSISEPEEQYSKFKYQRMEHRGEEHTPISFPGLKLTEYSKFGNEMFPNSVAHSGDIPCLDKPRSMPSLEPWSQEISTSKQHVTEVGSISVSPSQYCKPQKPGAVPTPEVTKIQGQRQAEEMMVGEQHSNIHLYTQSGSLSTAAGNDLLHLLDPLSEAEKPFAPPLPPRPVPPPFQLPPFLNPFTQAPHYVLHKHYGPVPPENPFSPVAYESLKTAGCFHTPPLYLRPQTNQERSTGRSSQASNSSSSLCSLLDSPPPPSLAQVLPPTKAVNTNDPFSDLVTMATASAVVTNPPQKSEGLQRRWETFD